ncbi:hypothetical protein QO021_28535 (plasmid) [Pseudomonas amygdali pv. lachrymans]|uniref:hypothetical protein n=1 Tax=Pseudomonas amygdali TaxID=47877 RepID=UPI0006B8C94C|nr:hypothetical protein [Pseudomonas amygdali]RMM39349.1 hypothetical protein ALQ79_200043 [Pseudomonas amygdali pv. lachrymans]WIO61507.1 hypothetical protein QO021_28535 [Pseudomonas amygdali pv. lachrymans]
MTYQAPKFTVESLVNLLADIRAPFIAGEIASRPFSPARNQLYLEYSFELLRLLLPVAAQEKACSDTAVGNASGSADHQLCNRAIRMMLEILDNGFYERFKGEHPKMPKQLTVREWGVFMMQARFHGWHSGVPVYPSPEAGVESATPLDFISEEQSAMARAARMGADLNDRDAFSVANELSGDYPHTSLSALVLVVTKAQSKQRVAHLAETVRGPAGVQTYYATIEQAERGVDAMAKMLGWSLTMSERESAIKSVYLAPPLVKTAA